MRKTHWGKVSSGLVRVRNAARTRYVAWSRLPVYKRYATSAVLSFTATAFIFTSFMPVLVQASSYSGAQVERHAKDIRDFTDKHSDRDLRDKRGIKNHLDDAFSKKWYHWGNKHFLSCRTVYKLSAALDFIDRLRERSGSQRLEELYTLVWTLRQEVLDNLPEGEVCDGFETQGSEPRVSLKESDNTKVSFSTSFSTPRLTTVQALGQTFTRVEVPGVEHMVGTPGEPALPVWRKLVAVPEGATPKLVVNRAEKGDQLRVNLVPFQDQPLDQEAPAEGENPQLPGEGDGTEDDVPPRPDDATFADKPFAYNERSYKVDQLSPAEPCKLTPMGQYRDVQMVQLECATGRYNPVTDQYILNKNLAVEVAFEGGEDKNFVTSQALSPFEGGAKTFEAALNRDAISKYVKNIDLSALPCFGEEFLILTHANFRDAADTLATHKRNKGISTSVFEVGSTVPSRDTAEEIDDFIEDRYDDCKVRPSYVMLLGDAEYIPTFYPAGMADNAGTDFPYSNYVQILFDAFFPDFGVGRVPVDTLAQANTVVDKIVNYESDPPNLGYGNGGPFYTTAGFASQFQCCRMNANGTPRNNQPGTDQRAFIETSELVRQELVDRGYNVPRIYTETVDNGGYCIQQNPNGTCAQTQSAYSGDDTPRRYYNGNFLPAAIGGSSGFDWDGSTADISDAWNEGRFLFLHRDHGWPGGWADPQFTTTDVDNLDNGELLPVVFSVNCASGMFDNETAGGTYNTTMNGVYFAERALRKADGGAIGVIGDTRNSPTWANNALTRGFFDAVWPDTVPGHGGNTSHKRLGDILNWGKVYLAGQVSATQTAGSISTNDMGYEYNIWHVIGDPTLEMWTRNPHKLILSGNISIERSRVGELIRYKNEGATITALQKTEDGVKPIGRAVVKDGVADMKYFEMPDANGGEVIYSASLDGSASVVVKPEGDGTTEPR